jgi:hypothetical protein
VFAINQKDVAVNNQKRGVTMTILPNQYDLDRLRREAMMDNADNSRKAKAATQQHTVNPLYRAALAATGDMLIKLGHELQERYGEETPQVVTVPNLNTESNCC